MTVEGLKPCPFCGSTASVVERDIPSWGMIYLVQCDKCPVEMHGDNATDAQCNWDERGDAFESLIE